MKTTVKKIRPDEFILSVLSPEERIDAAFRVAKEVFKKASLTTRDIENAVKSVRKRHWHDNTR
jgi:hypothetical protein